VVNDDDILPAVLPSKLDNVRTHTFSKLQVFHSDKDQQVLFAGGTKLAYNEIKMADGFHFENQYSLISQQQLK